MNYIYNYIYNSIYCIICAAVGIYAHIYTYAHVCTEMHKRGRERQRKREREKEQQLTETTQDTGKIEKQLNILKISTSRQPCQEAEIVLRHGFRLLPWLSHAFPNFPCRATLLWLSRVSRRGQKSLLWPRFPVVFAYEAVNAFLSRSSISIHFFPNSSKTCASFERLQHLLEHILSMEWYAFESQYCYTICGVFSTCGFPLAKCSIQCANM